MDGGEDATTGDTLSSDKGEEMTRDEVMAMTDDELRIKAAELGGWTAIGILNDGTPYGRPPAGWTPPIDDPNPYDSDNVWCLPNYPNDIAAAWELIAEWKPKGFMLYTDDKTHSKWMAHCTQRERPTLGDSRTNHVMTMSADTAPHAITRAFILAMEADNADRRVL